MKHITDILKENGYKEYRYIGFKFVENTQNDFSTMRDGGLAIFYVKDNDFDNPIIWGLHEFGKPPTLIKPRPKHLSDNEMNRMLANQNHYEIFELIKNP
jgi:hypothetical protein